MTLERFLKIVNNVLAEKGYPVDIHDLPDVSFDDYFDEDMDEDEAKEGAEELVEMMICDGDLPELD